MTVTAAAAAPARRSPERRAEILAAAAKRFQHSGYGASSMQDIADDLGIVKGSLYHHFDSKEELLAQLLLFVHQDALQMLDEVAAMPGPALERVRGYVTAHLRWSLQHRDRVDIMLREYHHLDAERAAEIAALRRRFSDFLTALITAAQHTGEADETLHPRVAANAILGMLNWLGQWHRPSDDLDDDQIAAQLTQQAIGSIRASTSSCSQVSELPGVRQFRRNFGSCEG